MLETLRKDVPLDMPLVKTELLGDALSLPICGQSDGATFHFTAGLPDIPRRMLSNV